MAHFAIVIERKGEWIVTLSVDGGVPFEESFTSKADAWRGAKEHADYAAPADRIDVTLDERKAEGLTAAEFVEWLRDAWRATRSPA